MAEVFLGIDVGSTTVKLVVLDRDRRLLAHRYTRGNGQPRQTLLRLVAEVGAEVDLTQIGGVGLTGSGGGPVAVLIGGHHVNELVAQTRAVGEYYPRARTVIEIGGQDSKFLSLAWDDATGRLVLVDFAMNALCAAGTGSFLDQQAERLGISIEGEFGALAVQSANPARIAGRCTVFAKSDMIHLQQQGTPLPDILAGLCLALARNFRSVIGRGKAFTPPVLFQGGVAYNAGVVRAFETVLGLDPGELIVPVNHHLMPALGTALVAMDEAADGMLTPFRGFAPIEAAIAAGGELARTMPALASVIRPPRAAPPVLSPAELAELAPLPVAVGIDVGSISTNVVLIDASGRVVARRYLPTAGRPLEAVLRGLKEVGDEVGDRVSVLTVGTTGSGRYLTADYVGGDVVRNEITAQARAALAIDPTVDTVFEIGGQDSKFIRLNHGAVVDFAMNNACAAGTGAFLEEQAERLDLDIKADFSRLALACPCPACLGERCTVFMESDVVHHQQQGATVGQITGGLAYAIAENYLNRIVNGRPIGQHIFFQGGVAWNEAVVAAFQVLTRRRVTVPPHHDVTGAIGVALLAQEALAERRARGEAAPTRFKGFDLSDREYTTEIFECHACPALCEVSRVLIKGEPPMFYGARCDRFEEAGRWRGAPAAAIPDLFAERAALLLGDYAPPEPDRPRPTRPRVGLPRTLSCYDLFPYWRAFFQVLDIEVVLSEPTNPRIRQLTLENAGAELCYPAKLVYGHTLDLLDQGVDLICLPSVIDREDPAPGQAENNYCPFIPATSYLVPAGLDLAGRRARVLNFPLHLLDRRLRRRELRGLAGSLGVAPARLAEADAAGEAALHEFQAALRARGQAVLAGLAPGQRAAVIVGRPYNVCDLAVCQDLPYKLRQLGILPIPMDFLPLAEVCLPARYGQMFWHSGQAILAAATLVRADPRLEAVYLTSFNCGPDSFLTSFFRSIMDPKPWLELEVDEHTADAGIVTRCEAFFESLAMAKGGR